MKKFKIFENRLKKIFKKTGAEKIIVAYSGGKDSTVLLHLCLEFAQKNPIKLVVLHGDTLVENPVIRAYCNSFLKKLQTWSEKEKFNVEIVVYTPESDRTFWVNLIGKGYPMPSFRFRWCQKHLKIKPAEKILEKHNKGVLFVGMRMDESIERKNSMKKRINNMELQSNGKMRVFAPMHDWTEADIWEFLLTHTPPWGGDYSELINLYKEARGECSLIPDPLHKSIGCGPRFGCWVCSVVRKDKTLKNFAQFNPIMQELLTFRNWLVEFSSKVENRFPFSRTGKLAKNGKGVLSFEARQEILNKLLDLQMKTGMKLIRNFELEKIRQIWKEDRENMRRY